MNCKYCNDEAKIKSYRGRSGQVNKEFVCYDCHNLNNKQVDYKYNNIKKK